MKKWTDKEVERFWKYVDKKSENECWNWIGTKIKKGYGRIGINGKLIGTHRFSWELHFDKIPDSLLVCHHCDNPSCVNPKHLFLGTYQDNIKDRDSKNRQAKGEKQGNSKLTKKQVKKIRNLKGRLTQRKIAKRFNISKTTVGDIHRNESWKEQSKCIFDWDHIHLYLAGAIDFTDDGGKGWRQEITTKLEAIGIPHSRILDPTNKKELLTHPYIKCNNEGELMKERREAGDIDGLRKIMKDVVHIDLAMVTMANFLIVNFPLLFSEDEYNWSPDLYYELPESIQNKMQKVHVPTYFTCHEIVVACQQKKPVFVIWPPDGSKSSSAWLIFMVGQENIFTNMDDCVTRIDDLMHGRAEIDPTKWLLFK